MKMEVGYVFYNKLAFHDVCILISAISCYKFKVRFFFQIALSGLIQIALAMAKENNYFWEQELYTMHLCSKNCFVSMTFFLIFSVGKVLPFIF